MATRRGPVSNSGTSKVAQRLRAKVENGDYYEALQTYKALYSRYRAQGRHQQALDLIYEGASTLLHQEQWECGHELAMAFLDFHKENKSPVTTATMDQVIGLFHQYALGPGTAVADDSIRLRLQDLAEINPRELFLKAALKWSTIVDDTHKYGHPQLHLTAARKYWKEKQYPLSADHFLYADDSVSFSEMLAEFSSAYGYTIERDLFIVRAVLQLLVLKKPDEALKTYRHYISVHPQLEYLGAATPPYQGEPSLNFAWFLIHSSVYLEEFTADVLDWIRTNYQGVIDRDPSFTEYLDKIGVLYCGIAPREPKPEANGLMGLLGGAGSGGLLDSLMGSSVPEEAAPVVCNTSIVSSDDVLD